jgi:hypothetical protein
MVRNRRRVLQCAAIFQVRGDPGRAERVVADRGGAVPMPAASARRRTIAFACGSGVALSCLVPRRTVRNSGSFGSSAMPVRSRYACRYASSVW